MARQPAPAVCTPAAVTLMELHEAGDPSRFFAHLEEHWPEIWYAFDPQDLRLLLEAQERPTALGQGAGLLRALTGAALEAPEAPGASEAPDASSASDAPATSVEPSVDGELSPEQRLQTVAFRASELRLAGRPAAALELMEQAAPTVRRSSGTFLDTSDGGACLFALNGGVTAMLAGDWARARAHFLRGSTSTIPSRFPFAPRDVAAKMALTHALIGDMGETRHWMNTAAQFPRTASWVEDLVDDSLWLADYVVAVEELDLERAEDLRRAKPSPLSHLEWWSVALEAQVRHLVLTGRTSSAIELCDAVAAAGLPHPGSDGWQAVALAQARMMCHDVESPDAPEGLAGDPWALLSRRLTLFRLGRFDEVALPSGLPPALPDSGGDVRPHLALDLLSAQALGQNGQTGSARPLLQTTLAAVLERGVLSLLQYLTPAGLELVADTPEGARVAALVEERGVPLLEISPISSTPLTAAEVAVLRLLRARRTRQEIADELFLSVHTVKSHLASAYRKLGVRTREEALARADQLLL